MGNPFRIKHLILLVFAIILALWIIIHIGKDYINNKDQKMKREIIDSINKVTVEKTNIIIMKLDTSYEFLKNKKQWKINK
jgi:hypothetical protein